MVTAARQLRRSDTRERIVEACAALLREGGPEAASQRAVCERTGIKAPTLYHHFGDLGRLHQVAVARAYADLAARKRAGVTGTALDRLRGGWDAYLAFARDEPGVFATLAREVVAGPLPAAAQASYRALVEDVRSLADERTLRHDVETAAQMLWAAAHGTACLVLAGRHGFAISRELSAALRETALAAIASNS